MNLIDFHVTKIISEEKDQVYKLYGMSKDEVSDIDTEEEIGWKLHLVSNGIKQKYEYWDDGGMNVGEEVFNLDRGDAPYYVGYVGKH